MAMQNLYTSKTPEMYASGDATVTMDSDVTYNSPAALHGPPTVANIAAGTQEATASIGPLARDIGGVARAPPELPARQEAAPARAEVAQGGRAWSSGASDARVHALSLVSPLFPLCDLFAYALARSHS